MCLHCKPRQKHRAFATPWSPDLSIWNHLRKNCVETHRENLSSECLLIAIEFHPVLPTDLPLPFLQTQIFSRFSPPVNQVSSSVFAWRSVEKEESVDSV